MRSVVVDWGTSRFRAYLTEGSRMLDSVDGDDGIARVPAGMHAKVLRSYCGAWLDREPEAAVMLVGMVGSREGWREAPYVEAPAGPGEVAAALVAVDLEGGRAAVIVPGLVCEAEGASDVMRGEETLVFGAAVEDGLVCLPGSHSKWVAVEGGRIVRFVTFLTGELYDLVMRHSMVGRPATEPEDPDGFALGVAAAERGGGENEGGAGILHDLFGARAAVLTGRLSPAALGPFVSGLLTGYEVAGALAAFPGVDRVTLVAPATRAALYEVALARREIATTRVDPTDALVAGLSRIRAALSAAAP